MEKNPKTKDYNKCNKNKLRSRIFLGISLVFFTVAAVFAVESYKTVNTEPLPIETNIVITEDAIIPEETEPKDDLLYAHDDPALIVLPTINAKGYIQKVGITKKNAIAVPSNIYVAGWFVESAKPGANGLSIIDGHVSGKYRDGLFKNIDKLQIEDKFTVEYGDGSLKDFKVLEVKTVSEKQSNEELFYRFPAVQIQLNLITCAGEYNNETQMFNMRVIVFAEGVE